MYTEQLLAVARARQCRRRDGTRRAPKLSRGGAERGRALPLSGRMRAQRPRLRYAFCGGSPAPLGRRPAPADTVRGGEPPKMERHPKQIHVRMSEREIASAKRLAQELGMTVSDLFRALLQLPAEAVREGGALVVVDRTTAARISREMTRWGHHYNQAVHALNAIAYYLRANDMDAAEVMEELARAERTLQEMQPGIESLRREAAALGEGAIAALAR